MNFYSCKVVSNREIQSVEFRFFICPKIKSDVMYSLSPLPIALARTAAAMCGYSNEGAGPCPVLGTEEAC